MYSESPTSLMQHSNRSQTAKLNAARRVDLFGSFEASDSPEKSSDRYDGAGNDVQEPRMKGGSAASKSRKKSSAGADSIGSAAVSSSSKSRAKQPSSTTKATTATTLSKETKKSGQIKRKSPAKSSSRALQSVINRGNITPPRIGVDLSALSPLFSPHNGDDHGQSPNQFMKNILAQPLPDMSNDGHNDMLDGRNSFYFPVGETATFTGFEDGATNFFGGSNLFLDYLDGNISNIGGNHTNM